MQEYFVELEREEIADLTEIEKRTRGRDKSPTIRVAFGTILNHAAVGAMFAPGVQSANRAKAPLNISYVL
jgi:hypothetical protein